MAVTNYALAGVSDETQKKLLQAQQAYQPGAATTQLQQNAAKLQASKPGEYKQSDAVTAAQNTVAQLQANKPQGYNSKYAGTLESIMQQIQNPEKFKYEFNGDNLYKAYADQYTQKGKQAALDVQGQAAALTGGYGNSYGQSVGQQKYQQFLTQLFDRGLELRNAAYQQYQDDQNAIKDRYNVLRNADESEYNRYRDTVGDWRADLENAQNVYNTERNVDYNRYRDMYGDWQTEEEQAYNRAKNQEQMDYERYKLNLDYWTGLAQIENAAYKTEQDRQEAIRQFNLEMEYKQDEFKYRWGLNAPAVVEEAPAYTPSPSPNPNPNPGEEKPKATVSWLTTTGNKIAAAAAAQKAQEDGKKLTERYKNTK